VLTNGGGVGALSADQLVALGGSLADLSSATVARLDSRLPVGWSRTNPVDLLTDIDAERYADTLGGCWTMPTTMRCWQSTCLPCCLPRWKAHRP
jgi:acyl-CoA synthetase (NDP forming)